MKGRWVGSILVGVVCGVALPPTNGTAEAARDGNSQVEAVTTGRRAELRETVPIGSRNGQKTKSVLSVGLPRLRRGSRIEVAGEVTISTTCVEQIARCIGRSYAFDPHLRARVVVAPDPDVTSRHRSVKVGAAATLTCEQTRPNRNHHCPLVVESGALRVGDLKDLPCPAEECRLNMLVDASSRKAQGGEVVVVGADQENGSVEGGKARLGAVVARGPLRVDRRRTVQQRRDCPPPSRAERRSSTRSGWRVSAAGMCSSCEVTSSA
ncbi:MAG: hypothetical protein R2700_16190 [Solirubrobacterales bacterium]